MADGEFDFFDLDAAADRVLGPAERELERVERYR
jgi:hypothetical protein